MPVIAIPRCSRLSDYEEAVRRAGGAPWVVEPAVASAAEVVRRAAGLLLAGGGDVDPALYGEAAHPTFTAAEPGRDEYEMELLQHAFEHDRPVFAICRGVQVLNVARGGTLVQDIPSEVPGALRHRLAAPPHPADMLAHDVRVDGASLLATLTAGCRDDAHACAVNSRHHQAVKRVGDGLIVSATAPDGIIEALEDPARQFCLGVQWHPENFYRTGEFRALFERFVDACT